MGQKERTIRYRSTGAAAGLVRVEVLVPPSGRQRILEEAAKLRAGVKRDPPRHSKDTDR